MPSWLSQFSLVKNLLLSHIPPFFQNSGKLTGIILLGVNETFVEYDLKPPTNFSGDSKCPNSHSSLYSDGSVESCGATNNPWNPSGSGILLEDWSFPIFLIDNPKSVQELILECYERNKPFLDKPRYVHKQA